MDYREIRAFVEDNVAYFADGDLARVERFFAAPIAVHERDQMQIYSRQATILETFIQRRRDYREQGIRAIQGSISAVELKRNQQFRFWVSWDYLVDHGTPPETTQVIYYCHATSPGFQIQMVQTNRSYIQASSVEPDTLLRARPFTG